MEESLSFYCDILGFKRVRSFSRGDGAEVIDLSHHPRQLGGIQLIQYPQMDEVPEGLAGKHIAGLEHIALLIDDMDETYANFLEKGVTTFVGEPMPKRPGFPRTARFYDPNGVLLELITYVQLRSDNC